jgi:hypothetical protein
MNSLKDFTHCIVPSRTKPIAYSCPLDLGSIFYFGPPYCYVFSSQEHHNFLLFIYVHNFYTILLPTTIYPHQVNHHDKNTNNKSRKKKIGEKINAKGSFDKHCEELLHTFTTKICTHNKNPVGSGTTM